jgi:hypothetical protein
MESYLIVKLMVVAEKVLQTREEAARLLFHLSTQVLSTYHKTVTATSKTVKATYKTAKATYKTVQATY